MLKAELAVELSKAQDEIISQKEQIEKLDKSIDLLLEVENNTQIILKGYKDKCNIKVNELNDIAKLYNDLVTSNLKTRIIRVFYANYKIN